MKETKDFQSNINEIQSILKLKESFDIIERILIIGGKKAYLYYIDGFTKDDLLQRIFTDFFDITTEKMNSLKTSMDFIENCVPYVEVGEETNFDTIITFVLSGQVAMFIEGYSSCIMLDSRTYPARSTQEPEKEKVLRGAKDGFVETIVFNTALIRRRIRDPKLIFEMFSVGELSRTDVAIGYLSGSEDKKALAVIKEKLKNLKVKSLTMSDQSIVEAITGGSLINPFPKVRYTERPDVAAAHILDGKIIMIVDNSPSVIILPTSFFDFLQDVDDYYLPVVTGNVLRFTRNLIFLATFLITPVFLLLTQNPNLLPQSLQFLIPIDEFAIPLIWQFLLLELSIDGLKLASLNTPSSLGMSLSVIGGLVLGEFAVKTGYFIPQSILYMAVVALGSFSQPSIEMGYAVKFMRIMLLVLVSIFNIPGFIIGLILTLCFIGFTKTLTGEHYLYPLIPLNIKELTHLVFRTRLKSSKK
ncbi:MAG: spore germination protein [Clostridium sp.]|uniref:spore germination protein n=1 Tax=Clostridium sp. TaxID=1506 RepID=UPI002FC713D0